MNTPTDEPTADATTDDPLSILRVSQWHYPEELGGGPYHVHALSRDQAARGHDVTVLTMSEDDTKPRREERDGYTVVRRRPLATPFGNELSPRLVADLRHAGDYDVVHAHSHFYAATNAAAVARRLGSTPLAITNHSLYSQSAPERVFRWYLRTVGRWTLDSADVIFCYTDEERGKLRELGVESPVEVVHNGIDHKRFSPDGDTDGRIDADGPALLFVGRLVEGKRPGDALDTLAGVRADHPDAHLYICGDGPLRSDIRAAADERGLADAVSFLGHVDHDEMPAIYRAADVLVLPSRAEGVPRTVMESLAAGTPAVVSDLPQIRTLVEGAGVTVTPGDTDGFADAVARLVGDPDRYEAFAAAGPETVRASHSWADTVDRTTARLRELADEHGGQ